MLLGLWQGAIAGLIWFENGKHLILAQRMLSVLMGGAIWHHAIGEGAASHSVGALVYLGLSAYVPILKGADPKEAAAIAAGLAVVGWVLGAICPRSPAAKGAAKKEVKKAM